MRKILGSQIQEGSNGVHNEDLQVYVGTEGHVSRMWENSTACIAWRGKVKERD